MLLLDSPDNTFRSHFVETKWTQLITEPKLAKDGIAAFLAEVRFDRSGCEVGLQLKASGACSTIVPSGIAE